VKVMSVASTQSSDFMREMNTMIALADASECVVQLFGIMVLSSSQQTCLVMEMCERGSLYHVLMQDGVVMTWGLALQLSLDAAAGLKLLHARNVVHRDVKSLNYLVTRDFRCKIADFGLARAMGSNAHTLATVSSARGTLLYCAPEVFQGMPYERSFDIYSFGIVLWEVVRRITSGVYARPYSDYSNELRFDFQLVIQITQNNLRPQIPGLVKNMQP
jgi:serine/threonine protein kinase